MKFGIMGAGSIGCFVGGRLAAAGSDVVLVGREHLRDTVAALGLTIIDVEQEPVHVPPARCPVVTDAAALADCDVVLVCVKSAATADVGQELAAIVAPNAVIVSLQNGVQNVPALKAALASHIVVPGIVSFNVVTLKSATVQRTMDGPIVLEKIDGDRVSAAVAAMRAAGLDMHLSDDMRAEQFSKLVVNLNNAISALSGAPTVQLLASAPYRRIIADVVDEALSVLKAAGIRPARFRGVPLVLMPKLLRLPTPVVRVVLRAQMQVDPEARSSMWEDLDRGRLTEVEYLNGEIVRRADASGHPAPLNRRIVELVHAAEAKVGSPNLNAAALRAALDAG